MTTKQVFPTALDHLSSKLKVGLIAHHYRNKKTYLSRFKCVMNFKGKRGVPYSEMENGQIIRDVPKLRRRYGRKP